LRRRLTKAKKYYFVKKKDINIAPIFNPKKITMKKLFAILAITAFMTSCNDTETKSTADSDSAKAAATADSLKAIQALSDTAMKPMDSTTIKVDTTMTSKDTTKK